MKKMRAVLASACVAAAMVAGCDNPPSATVDGGGVDARLPMADAQTRDGGDPCEGLTLCTTAGTSCDGDSLVTCAANADGCLVETTDDCAADGDVCDDGGGTAACVDPCSLIPEADRCTTEGRSCDTDTLVVCAMDAQGCLVQTRTDCATMDPVAECDDTGEMPVCAVPDPCEGIVQCGTAETRVCSDATTITVCAADAAGCFVETVMPCPSGEACDDATTTCVDLCAGVDCTGTGTTCTPLACNPTNGLCETPAPVTDGTACDDADDCTTPDTCTAGACGGTSACAFSYFEDFEGSDGGWTTSGTASSWAWGTPSEGTWSGTGAWATNLAGAYANSEASFVVSPVLDMTSATTDPILRLAINYNTESCCDEGWIDVSTDGGTTWTRLGTGATGVNWYNDSTNNWWDGTNGGWRIAQHVLTGTAGQAMVRIRVGFSSDSSVTRTGFAIDDVTIRTDVDTDLAVEAVDAVSGCAVAANPISFRAINLGTADVTSFTATATFGTMMVTQTFTSTIAPGTNQTFTFTDTLDLRTSTGGVVEVRTTIAGDDAPSNDVRTQAIAPIVPLTLPLLETFDSGDGGWIAGGAGSTWQHGTPAGPFITAAASGTGAWVTNLTGDYANGESSWVASPCFDASAIAADPTLSFSHIYETEGCCDEGWIEIWTSSTGTWTTLGASGAGTNWYNDATNQWWDGTSGAAGAWRTASHLLTGAAGQTFAIRHRFSSDGSVSNDGFGLDDVSIAP